MKLFVDDFRVPPEGYEWARTVDEAKSALSRGDVEIVSLDHDLGACDECKATGKSVGDMQTPETTFFNWCPHVDDGTSLARWMVDNGHLPRVMYVHSHNPLGTARMNAILGLSE